MLDFNFAIIAIAVLFLLLTLLDTRKHDGCGWWFFRIFMVLNLLAFIYIAMGIHVFADDIFVQLMRFGFLTLSCSIFLISKLYTNEAQKQNKRDFQKRLLSIFQISKHS